MDSVVIIALLALVLLVLVLARVRNRLSCFPKGKILFVIAHPDDECMFFAPAILSASKNNPTYLLCLCNGDFYGQGKIREKEFHRSCATLGVAQDHVILINDQKLLDGPDKQWDVRDIEKHLVQIIRDHKVEIIISFDDWGVSGHTNHIAISKCLRELLRQSTLPDDVKLVLSLESVGILRKYSSIIDVLISLILNWNYCALSNTRDFMRAQIAMRAHASQLFWFRILYVVFSRYMIVNTFKPLYIKRNCV